MVIGSDSKLDNVKGCEKENMLASLKEDMKETNWADSKELLMGHLMDLR